MACFGRQARQLCWPYLSSSSCSNQVLFRVPFRLARPFLPELAVPPSPSPQTHRSTPSLPLLLQIEHHQQRRHDLRFSYRSAGTRRACTLCNFRFGVAAAYDQRLHDCKPRPWTNDIVLHEDSTLRLLRTLPALHSSNLLCLSSTTFVKHQPSSDKAKYTAANRPPSC